MVDLVTDAEVLRSVDEAKLLPALAPSVEPGAAPAEPKRPPAPPMARKQTNGMVAATELYAASILSDPANVEVRDNFPLLADDEQVIQICNIEALEQLREAAPGERPDAIVGYAFDSLDVVGLELTANGGAYRRGGQWYRVRYHCVAAAGIGSVAAFEYAVGDRVPESEWEAHFLNGTDE